MAQGTTPNARPSLREEQKRFTRNRLIEAAVEILSEHGYAASTVDQIVAAAGASRATFYLHFKSKTDLVQQMTRESQSATFELYEQVPVYDSPRADLAVWLDALVKKIERDPFIGIYSQAVTLDPTLAKTYEHTVKRLADIVVEKLGAPAEETERLRLQARLLIVQLERTTYLWLVQGWKFNRTSLLEALTDCWYRGLASTGTEQPTAQEVCGAN
jgi:AcrR family transcriptional regulator